MTGAFRKILNAFNESVVEYVIVGGIATILHGVNRATADLDLVIELTPQNASRAIGALTDLGYKPLLPVPANDFVDEEKRKSWINKRNLKVFSLWDPNNELPNVDIFAENPIAFSELSAESETVDLGGIVCTIASIQHLIQMKTDTGRTKDQEDIQNLKNLLEDSHE